MTTVQKADVIYRKANVEDLGRIIEITKEVVALLNSEGNYQWNSTYPLESDFRKDIDLDQLWVATFEGRVMGFAAITTDQPEEYGDVGYDVSEMSIVPHRVAVSLESQNQGIAKGFMLKSEEIARERGYRHVRVDTNVKNPRMQRVIEKLGYEYGGKLIQFKNKLEINGEQLYFKCYQKLL